MKKFLSAFITMVLILASIPSMADYETIDMGNGIIREVWYGMDGSVDSVDKLKEPSVKNGVLTVPYVEGGECLSISIDNYEKSLEKIYFENGYKEIFGPFYGADVYIPASVEAIYDDDADNFFVDEENPTLCDIDGVLFSKDKTELKIYGKARDEESYTVPDGVARVGSISNSALKKLYFPEGVTEIDSLYGDELNDIAFPSSLKKINILGIKNSPWYQGGDMRIIGDGILIGPCKSESLTTSPEVKCIASGAFSGNRFISIHIGASVKSAAGAFFGCVVTDEIILEEGIEEIDFPYLNKEVDTPWLKELVLPESIKYIPSEAFCKAKIESIYVPENAKAEGRAAYRVMGKIYTGKGGEFQKSIGGEGYLCFDSETKQPILPEYTGTYAGNRNGAYQIALFSNAEQDYARIPSDASHELIFEGDKRPFVFMQELYVPLRLTCEIFDIPVYWNEELKIAEVGDRGKIEPSIFGTEIKFGNENLVRYNGKIASPRISVGIYLDEDPSYCNLSTTTHAEDRHSAVNIDGSIYVPLVDLADNGLLPEYIKNSMTQPTWVMLIETE